MKTKNWELLVYMRDEEGRVGKGSMNADFDENATALEVASECLEMMPFLVEQVIGFAVKCTDELSDMTEREHEDEDDEDDE